MAVGRGMVWGLELGGLVVRDRMQITFSFNQPEWMRLGVYEEGNRHLYLL